MRTHYFNFPLKTFRRFYNINHEIREKRYVKYFLAWTFGLPLVLALHYVIGNWEYWKWSKIERKRELFITEDQLELLEKFNADLKRTVRPERPSYIQPIDPRS